MDLQMMLDAVLAGQPVSIDTTDEEATAALAERLGAVLPDGAVLALSGPLGAGKTAFVKGLARGLGLPAEVAVTSPTYALVNRYTLPCGRTFHHADLYRLGDDPGELEALGFRDWLADSRCVAMEWAEQCREAMDAADLMVRIDDLGPTARRIHLTPRPSLRTP